MALEAEMQTYRTQLPLLLQDEGKFVLIVGTHVIDTYTSYEDAIKGGYKEAGLEPFLVKKIEAVEQVHYITRDSLTACLT